MQVAHTSELDREARRAIHDLLFDVFGDEMTELDYDHALGGMHALVWAGSELIGHGSVVQRQVIADARTLRAGFVEGVAVRADQRRRGHAAAMMQALEAVIRGAYPLGVLGASEQGALLYEARAWQRWQGTAWALTPRGRVRTPGEDGDIYVLPVSAVLELTGELTCDWREGDLW